MRSLSVHSTRQVLNRALNLQRFSLANYLRFARPWAREADHVLLAVVFGIADVQRKNSVRVGELLVERHASVEPGVFPMRFTGLNDLSILYAAPHVVEDLERIVQELCVCGDMLRDDRTAWDLVQTILHDDQRHLQILRDELHHAQESAATERQLVYLLDRDGKVAKDAAGQRSPANVIEVPRPA
jgi:hypothetical protein